MDAVSGVGDDEINQMIANLKGENPGAAAQVANPLMQNQPANAVNSANIPNSVDSVATNINNGVNQNQPIAKNMASSQMENISQSDNSPTTNNVTDAVDAAKISPNTTAANLEEIKTSAIHELRPLVDKLELPAEDKFDTLLLLIRSTDDSSLIGMAHEAAAAITDDARRAQALLEIIKEIDFFSQNSAQEVAK